jgi:hypothetical protein
VVDPTGTKADGRCVRYGDVIVLMDQRGYTLNNKTGGRTGYVDMKYVHVHHYSYNLKYYEAIAVWVTINSVLYCIMY